MLDTENKPTKHILVLKNTCKFFELKESYLTDIKLLEAKYHFNDKDITEENTKYFKIIEYKTDDEALFYNLVKLLTEFFDTAEEFEPIFDYFQIEGDTYVEMIKKYIGKKEFMKIHLSKYKWDDRITIDMFNNIDEYLKYFFDNKELIGYLNNYNFWLSNVLSVNFLNFANIFEQSIINNLIVIQYSEYRSTLSLDGSIVKIDGKDILICIKYNGVSGVFIRIKRNTFYI